jgi:hypothetical protein
MAFSSALSSLGGYNFVENLILSNALHSPIFSFYFGRAADAGIGPEENGYLDNIGQLCIGCVDATKFTGNISFVPRGCISLSSATSLTFIASDLCSLLGGYHGRHRH